jgi:hypothetical protein
VTIILLVWWSLARGNHVVPSRWQATPVTIRRTRRWPKVSTATMRSLVEGRGKKTTSTDSSRPLEHHLPRSAAAACEHFVH